MVVPVQAKGIQIYSLRSASTTAGGGTPTSSTPASISTTSDAQSNRLGALFGMAVAAAALAWLL
jgi:hypothetical protein